MLIVFHVSYKILKKIAANIQPYSFLSLLSPLFSSSPEKNRADEPRRRRFTGRR
jgi:hypothetical protein